MDRRHTIATLAAGAVLALGASTADATLARTALPHGAATASSSSAAATKALVKRWTAIQKIYASQHRAKVTDVRPDDRAGPLGVGAVAQPATSPDDAIRGRGPLQ